MLAERARGGEDRQALLDDILKIVLDPGVADDQVGARLRGEIGHERMRAAWQARREPLPRDHGHLAMMDASMAYLRQFVPDVLAAIRFAGGPGMDDLLQAVTILAGLYATKARKVPDGAPGGFVPARWAGYLEKAAKDGDVTAYRHYWELCALMATTPPRPRRADAWALLPPTRLLDAWVPADDARLALDPAVVIAAVVANLAIEHRPLYALRGGALRRTPRR